MTLIPSTGLYHPEWCDQLIDCEQHGHHSRSVSGHTKRVHAGRPEARWSFRVSDRNEARGAHVWGMITVANELLGEKTTAVLMCDPVEALRLATDLINAAQQAQDEDRPQDRPATRPVLEVVR